VISNPSRRHGLQVSDAEEPTGGRMKAGKMRAKGTPLERIQHRIRVSRLNTKPGIQIAPSVYIAKTAMIQTDSDGHSFGGRIRISPGVTVSDGVIIATYGGTIAIEANVYIGPYCVLYGHGGLAIGRDTMIGAHTVIIAANHGFSRIDIPMNAQPLTREGIDIGEDVWVGSGCQILDGIRIEQGAVVGAGSIVTKDIDAHSIAFGVPALVVGSRPGWVEDRSPARNR
jgi:acetyltransferase-like isoleucine patch superfamily enzyme